MKSHIVAAVMVLSVFAPGMAMAESLGRFSDSRDIGSPKMPGSASYDARTGAYTVVGGGGNMWTDHDSFHFLWKKLPAGDIAVSTDLKFLSPSPAPDAPGYVHRKGGVIIRQDLDPDSAYVDALRMGNQQLSLQYRDVKGGQTRLIWINTPYQGTVKLERIGDYVYLSVPDANGKLHHAGGSFKLKLTGSYLVGLGACAHDNNVAETMQFTHVKIEPITHKAAPRLESTLQTADIHAPQEQTAVFNTVGDIAAPTWSSDGKSFVYESRGAIYRIPVDGGAPVKINASDAKGQGPGRDLSPDGQWLYFSAPAGGMAKIWRAHPDGSGKTQITSNSDSGDFDPHPSPDGKWLVYLATKSGKLADHQDAELRLIPLAGGTPQTDKTILLATFLGGEGSLAAPSWSPDSAHVAFASYRLAQN